MHVEIYSHDGELAPVYSTESALGIVLATGNLGTRLSKNDEPKNLYISRDGGLTWASTRPGTFIYEIGDHGALIVIAKKNVPTTQIEFTWDEGLTWSTLQISTFPIFVENIIIEPNSISQQFLLYGVAAPAADDEEQERTLTGNKAILTYLDFSSLHVRECEGYFAAQYQYGESDYEQWSPHDGRHGTTNNCFLGQHVTYVRRK